MPAPGTIDAVIRNTETRGPEEQHSRPGFSGQGICIPQPELQPDAASAATLAPSSNEPAVLPKRTTIGVEIPVQGPRGNLLDERDARYRPSRSRTRASAWALTEPSGHTAIAGLCRSSMVSNGLEHFPFLCSEPQASACAVSRRSMGCAWYLTRYTKTGTALVGWGR